MIKTKMTLEENKEYSIIINTIKLDEGVLSEEPQLFDFLKTLQKGHPKAIIQLFSTRYMINKSHLLYAIYFTLKALHQQTLISNRPSIELLLYLSCNRQIREGIRDFGISNRALEKGTLNYCIVAKPIKINKINEEFLEYFNYSQKLPDLNRASKDKFTRIKSHFDISDIQLKTKLNSLGGDPESQLDDKEDLQLVMTALCDLVVEKMVLLSLEGT